MRIADRKLRQIIREELVHEAIPSIATTDAPVNGEFELGPGNVLDNSPKDLPSSEFIDMGSSSPAGVSATRRKRIPNDTVREIQRELGIKDDGFWGKDTEKAWDTFIEMNFSESNASVVSIEDLKKSWSDSARVLGLDPGAKGALDFIRTHKTLDAPPTLLNRDKWTFVWDGTGDPNYDGKNTIVTTAQLLPYTTRGSIIAAANKPGVLLTIYGAADGGAGGGSGKPLLVSLDIPDSFIRLNHFLGLTGTTIPEKQPAVYGPSTPPAASATSAAGAPTTPPATAAQGPNPAQESLLLRWSKLSGLLRD